MIKLFFSLLLLPFASISTIGDLPELSVAVKIGSATDYTLITGEDTKYSAGTSVGGYSSRVSVEGAHPELKIPVNTPMDFYMRTKSNHVGADFSLFRMEIKDDKKRVASSSDLTGSKIEKIRTNVIITDPAKKIFHVVLVDSITPGIYGCMFKNVTKEGHFDFNSDLGKTIFCFEITQ